MNKYINIRESALSLSLARLPSSLIIKKSPADRSCDIVVFQCVFLEAWDQHGPLCLWNMCKVVGLGQVGPCVAFKQKR